jgi:hypothetical protein
MLYDVFSSFLKQREITKLYLPGLIGIPKSILKSLIYNHYRLLATLWLQKIFQIFLRISIALSYFYDPKNF